MYQPLTYIASVTELKVMSHFSVKPIDPRNLSKGFTVIGTVYRKNEQALAVPVMDLPNEHMANMVRDMCSVVTARYS